MREAPPLLEEGQEQAGKSRACHLLQNPRHGEVLLLELAHRERLVVPVGSREHFLKSLRQWWHQPFAMNTENVYQLLQHRCRVRIQTPGDHGLKRARARVRQCPAHHLGVRMPANEV
ncbi:hypothetical protein D9M69_658160 [compost metagenome]